MENVYFNETHPKFVFPYTVTILVTTIMNRMMLLTTHCIYDNSAQVNERLTCCYSKLLAELGIE
jgi:hypothetical protein